jgi:hypothetical protein
VNQCARQGHALTLSPRIRAHRTIDESSEVEAFYRAQARTRGITSVETRRKLEILSPAEVKVAKRLVPRPAEHAPNRRATVAERPVIDCAGCCAGEGPDDREQGGLAGSIRTLDDRDGARRKGAGHSDEGADRSVRLGHVAELHDRHCVMFAAHANRRKFGPNVALSPSPEPKSQKQKRLFCLADAQRARLDPAKTSNSSALARPPMRNPRNGAVRHARLRRRAILGK